MPSDTVQDSPPPTRPTSSSPGIRANALQRNFDQALAHTLKTCSYANFSGCFPTPAKYVPESLTGLHREFIAKLDHVCRAEFAALLEERDVVASLNELDSLIADARNRMERAEAEGGDGTAKDTPTPPHLLPPQVLLDAHLAPFLASQTDNLTSDLELTRQNNADLSEEIETQRATIESLIQGLENLVSDIEGATVALSGQDMDGVAAELEQAATSAGTG